MAGENQDVNQKRGDGLVETLAAFSKLNPNPLLEVDFAGKLTYSNEASIRILEDLGIADPADFLPKDLGKILKIVKQGKETWFYREVSVGDKIFGLDLHVDHNFKVLRIYGIEITEWEKTRRELGKYHDHLEDLQEAKYVLENLLDSSADPVGVVDAKGRIIRWNKAAEEVYGYSAAELQGKHFSELYEDPAELEKMVAKLRRDGFVREYEIDMKNKDGNIVPFNLSINLLYDRQHNLTGSLCIARDRSDTLRTMAALQMLNERLQDEIIERRRAEEALQESEKRLANIIDFLPDATLVIDKEGKVVAWNKAIEKMTGISASDMVGQGNYEYALPFYGKRRPILIDLVLKPQTKLAKYTEINREGLSLSAVSHFPNFRGRETYLSSKASILLDSQGNIVGAIESIRDITLRRHRPRF